MNPDEQNNNPVTNPDPAMGADGVVPVAEPISVGEVGAAPQPEAMSGAVDMNATAGMGTTVDLNAASAGMEALAAETPVADPMMGAAAPTAESAPVGGAISGMGEVSATTDTTFTPVTAGQEVPAPVAPEAAAPEATAAPVMDTAAPVNPAEPAVAAPVAPVAGAPAKKFQLNKTTIILMAVAGVAIIGVIVVLIISSLG